MRGRTFPYSLDQSLICTTILCWHIMRNQQGLNIVGSENCVSNHISFMYSMYHTFQKLLSGLSGKCCCFTPPPTHTPFNLRALFLSCHTGQECRTAGTRILAKVSYSMHIFHKLFEAGNYISHQRIDLSGVDSMHVLQGLS